MRRQWVGSALALGLTCAVGPSACSAPDKGSLVLAISTDMRTPKDVNVVSVFVSTDGVPKFDYLGRVLPDGTVALPATLAIVEPDNPSAQVRVRVTAFQDQNARVLRDVLTTVPHAATSLLRLPLNFLDDGSGIGQIPTKQVPGPATGTADGDTAFDPTKLTSRCPFEKGQTSINGVCSDAHVDSAKLPAYTASEVYGDGGLTPTGALTSCFDVAACFAGAVPIPATAVATTASGCTAALPAGVQASSLNLALVTPSTGECLAPGECYVPLESDPTEGFTVSGGTLHMIPGICAKIAGGAQLYASSGACAPKTLSSPVCEPVAGSTGSDASAPADAGPSACDGNYVVTCADTAQCGGGMAQVTVAGTTAALWVPQDHGGGTATTYSQASGTVDPSTCLLTAFFGSPDGGSCGTSGNVSIDLTPGAQVQIPCGNRSPDGQCTPSMLTCTVSRGTVDAGSSAGGDASPGTDAGVGPTVTAVSGSVATISLSAVDSAFATGTTGVAGGASTISLLGLAIADTPGVCSVEQQALAGEDQSAGSVNLSILLEGNQTTPIGPGVYAVGALQGALGPGQTAAVARFAQATAACSFAPSTSTAGIPDSQATGGSVTVAQVSPTTVSGSFDLVFGQGELVGSFSTPLCNGVNLPVLATTNGSNIGQSGPDANSICYDGYAPPPADGGAPPADGGVEAGDSGTDAGDGGTDAGAGDGGTTGCYPLPGGAVSSWRGENGTSDAFGTNPATWTGSPSYGAGVVGNAFLFGGGSYLSASVTGVDFSAGGTIEGWMSADAVPATVASVFGFATSSTSSMNAGGLVALNAGTQFEPEFALGTQTVMGASYDPGFWVHVAIVSNPPDDAGTGLVQLYLDGSLYMEGNVSTADAGIAGAFLMGGDGAGADFQGLLDEVTIYDSALPASDIQGIWAAGSAGKCSLP